MTDGAKTIEYWSGTRRVLYTPCSETDIYIALTMLDSDEAAKAVPVRKDEWKRAFPHLETLIDRIGDQGRYDRFDLIKLKRWSAGRVAHHRRRRACAAAEYRPGRRLRDDECAVARGLSRPRERRRRGARNLGAQRAAAHRAHAAHLVFSRLADDLAAGGARRSRSALLAARNGWCGNARAPRCTGRRGRKGSGRKVLKTES